MNDQKTYWEKKIVDWEESVYKGKNSNTQPFFEKIATPFRKLNKVRTDTTEKLISLHIKNKIVADLGCGTGVFLEKLLKYKPKQIVGVDIASAFASANLTKIECKTELFLFHMISPFQGVTTNGLPYVNTPSWAG